MRLAVTGVTSGVGRRLAEIARARGDTVSGLVRDPNRADARSLAALGVRIVAGDLSDHTALEDVARGADAFLHLATHVGDWGSREEFERVNVGGTKSAIEAAAKAKVARFVQLSSTAVYGRPDSGRVTEEWPTRKIGVPYDDTKIDAERLAFSRGAELGLTVAAVRPPVIYGPYDRQFLPRIIDALKARRFLLVDGGRAPWNLVWVDHVVDVALLAAEHESASGEAFNVMDEVSAQPPSVREVAERVAEEAGLPRPRLSLPFPIAMALGRVVERAYVIARAQRPPPVTPFVIRILTRDVIYDASKAARMLGWKSRIRSIDGVALFARAFKEARGN